MLRVLLAITAAVCPWRCSVMAPGSELGARPALLVCPLARSRASPGPCTCGAGRRVIVAGDMLLGGIEGIEFAGIEPAHRRALADGITAAVVEGIERPELGAVLALLDGHHRCSRRGPGARR